LAKYRVQLDFITDNELEARRIYDLLKQIRGLFQTINRGRPDEERSRLNIHICYHDETPVRPCEIIESIESE